MVIDHGNYICLTSVVKCFERLVKSIITPSLPATLHPLQFAHHPNRSTDDAISHLLHTTLAHLDTKRGSYARLLLIDYSSAFKTIIPRRLVQKLCNLSLLPSLCRWIHSFKSNQISFIYIAQHLNHIASMGFTVCTVNDILCP